MTVPDAEVYYNEVLPKSAAVAESVRLLGWRHPTPDKTWDFFKATHCLQDAGLPHSTPILDAGCVGSPILEWLYGRGYRQLYGVDLSSHDLPAVPGLRFRRADLTDTPFPTGFFGAITCMSVIEHGVDLDRFVAEAARLLAEGGLLLLSCDYHDPKIDTSEVPPEQRFGLPWTILDRADAESLIAKAEACGLHLLQPVRWEMDQAPVSWNGKQYTFLFLGFTKAVPA